MQQRLSPSEEIAMASIKAHHIPPPSTTADLDADLPSRSSRQMRTRRGHPSDSASELQQPMQMAAVVAAAMVPMPAATLARGSTVGGLVVPPRLFNYHTWLAAYVLPLLLWIFSSVWGFSSSLVFFTPEAPDVSDDWVVAGWIFNWVALVIHVTLVVVIVMKKSPFSPFVGIGTLVLLSFAALASISHSNALLARHVTSPVTNGTATLVQAEWLAVALLLLTFLTLLYRTPRGVHVPIMAQLALRSKADIMSATRQLQGEVTALSRLVENNRAHEQIALQVAAAPGQSVRVDINGQVQQVNPTSAISQSALNEILRSTRAVRGSRKSEDLRGPPLFPDAAALEVPASESRADARRSHRSRSRRHSRRSMDSVALSAQLANATDSRAVGKNPNQSDFDMQKIASALRSARGPTETPVVTYHPDDEPPADEAPRSHRKTHSHALDAGAVSARSSHKKKKGRSSAGPMTTSLGRGTVGEDFFETARKKIKQQQQEARDLEQDLPLDPPAAAAASHK